MSTHTQTGSMGVETIILDMLRPAGYQPPVIPGKHIRIDIIGGPVTISTRVAGQATPNVKVTVEDDAIIFDMVDLIEIDLTASGAAQFSVTDYDDE